MKIVVNYDLLDKIKESKTGLSVNRVRRDVLRYTTINMAIETPFNVSQGADLNHYILDLFCFMSVHCISQLNIWLFFSNLLKNKAQQDLNVLASQLQDIFVRTDKELLQDAYKYKTEFELDCESSKIPNILQKKYIMVPVHNDWDNNERSLVQEHIIGSKEYFLS